MGLDELLKAADFNEKLRDRGVEKTVTVQRICKVSKDEKEVREIIDKVWKTPEVTESILLETAVKNKQVYDFENMLEE